MYAPSTLFAIDTERAHISDPYNRIACTTDLFKLANTLGSAPSCKSSVPSLPQPSNTWDDPYIKQMIIVRLFSETSCPQGRYGGG